MTKLSIGQLAAKAKLNASALRFYESVGLLPVPERKSGQRRYDEQLLDRLHFIKIAQQTGFTIQEISVLLEGFAAGEPLSERWERMAAQKRSELEQRQRQIHTMIRILDKGLDCKCLTWSECHHQLEQMESCSGGASW